MILVLVDQVRNLSPATEPKELMNRTHLMTSYSRRPSLRIETYEKYVAGTKAKGNAEDEVRK